MRSCFAFLRGAVTSIVAAVERVMVVMVMMVVPIARHDNDPRPVGVVMMMVMVMVVRKHDDLRQLNVG